MPASSTARALPALALPLLLAPAIAQPAPDPVRHRVLAADASKGRLAIFGPDGKIEWETAIRQIHDLHLLENGNILFQTTWTRLVEMNRDKEVVWSYDAATANGNAGRKVEVHAFQRLADGVTMIAESGPGRIIEVDRQGGLLREVAMQLDSRHPHRDTRLVRKLQSGHYLAAHEGDGAVREYDRSGKVVWEFRVPLFGRPRKGGHGPDAWGNQVFAAVRLPNGNTLISTGNGHSVLEVDPDKEIVWHLKQDDLPGVRLAWVTTLEVLPNGNYLIGNCHAGRGQPQILEVTPRKEVVWSFEDFDKMGNALSNSTLVDARADALFYTQKVEPILAAHCYKCHGTRGEKVRGGLWLRTRHNILAGSASGPIVDLVRPERSRILPYINHEDEERRMPPKEKLPQQDIDVLTEWVQRGVPMPPGESEWRYERPSMFTDAARAHWSFQPVADPAPPAVRDAAWCRDDLDRFVLARLEAAGLTPNGAADRVSFVRRATFDLTGLPPTQEEVQAFVADRVPGAHARLIDRLLASPHYGERWGRHWLDLVRYAETNGYERDSDKPHAWRYRQYVIDAFNANKPYDRFVLEQLAGDELDDAGAESITGTGFLRLGLWDDEPADGKQAVYDGLDDVVRTTSEVFLGMTMGCARCHDHKLDPIPQADYYSFLAFFHNLRPYSRDKRHILTDVATPAQRAALAAKNEQRQARRAELQAEMAGIRRKFAAAVAPDGGLDAGDSGLRDLTFEFYRETWEALPDFTAFKPETVGKVPSGRFDISLATRESGFGFVFKGTLSAPEDATYEFSLDSDDGSRLSIDGKPVLTYDGIHGTGTVQRKRLFLTRGEHPIQLEYFQWKHGKGLFVAWRGPGIGRRVLSLEDQEGDDRRVLRRLRREGDAVLGAGTVKRYDALQREHDRLRDADHDHYVLSAHERGTQAPDTFVLTRGSAHAPAQKVEPAFPRILTATPPAITPRQSSSGRRRALGEWMVQPSNQLTARVMVNRIWQYHFGRGLARSSSDFGMQGRPPTHPRLLDWLARRFVESGWDIKKLHRRIMLSATYRLSSAPNPRASAEDPTNDLLWRYDLRRLSAEELRDAVLAVSGQLDLSEFGGPSVYPTIPEAVLAGQSRVTWRGDGSVANNSRRSVYTFVKRSLVDPLIESFDGATTDTSCAERFQTTQPTQALTLINSGFMHKAAAALAARLADTGGDRRGQVEQALRLTTLRAPTPDQLRTALAFLETFPDPVGEQQALQQLCLIALNLNEFLFID